MIDKGFAFFRKTTGLAQVAPVGRSVAGTSVFIYIHKGLDKVGFDAEQGRSVLQKKLQGTRQQVRSQIADIHPRQD